MPFSDAEKCAELRFCCSAIDPLVPKYRERYAKRAEPASGRTKSERIPKIILPPYYGGVKRTRAESDPDYDDGDDDDYGENPGVGKRSRNSY